ncbi:hypothetical protein SRB5_11810 [Streptomyces sp. RB5]|uniref:Uncharacterized protein n=1 Tax=Streptomyces smaragdinus TaxID=2585196 RepID=A0A7K0CC86_9ACTN|nr:hypothetical protein [Streptomyces smaragdinus]MQY11067.1 hypothetical protein [Streptomyces smaragdinus]
MDWDAPYCSDSPGPHALAAELPGTGSVSVRLADQSVPGCLQDSTHPELRSFLSPGPVSAGDARPTGSALSTLTTRIFPGPKLNITWRLITRGFPSGLPYVVVTIPTGT